MKNLLLLIIISILSINTFSVNAMDKMDCSTSLNNYSAKKINSAFKGKVDEILPSIGKKYSDNKLFVINQKIINLLLNKSSIKNDKTKYPIYLYLLTELDKQINKSIISTSYVGLECSIVKKLHLSFNSISPINNTPNTNTDINTNTNTNDNLKTYNYNPQGKIVTEYASMSGGGCDYLNEWKTTEKLEGRSFDIKNFKRSSGGIYCDIRQRALFAGYRNDANGIITEYQDRFLNKRNDIINNSIVFRKFITWDKIKTSDIKIINGVKSIKNSQGKYFPIDNKSINYKIINLNSKDYALSFSNLLNTNLLTPLMTGYAKNAQLINFDTFTTLEKKGFFKNKDNLGIKKYAVKGEQTIQNIVFGPRIKWGDGIVLLPLGSPRPISYEVGLSDKEYNDLKNENKILDAYDQKLIQAKVKLHNLMTVDFNPFDGGKLEKQQNIVGQMTSKYRNLSQKKIKLIQEKWGRKNVCIRQQGMEMMEDKTSGKGVAFKNYDEYEDFVADHEYLIRYNGDTLTCK